MLFASRTTSPPSSIETPIWLPRTAPGLLLPGALRPPWTEVSPPMHLEQRPWRASPPACQRDLAGSPLVSVPGAGGPAAWRTWDWGSGCGQQSLGCARHCGARCLGQLLESPVHLLNVSIKMDPTVCGREPGRVPVAESTMGQGAAGPSPVHPGGGGREHRLLSWKPPREGGPQAPP